MNLSSYNGILLVNKPSGLTSHDLVLHVRKTLKQKTIGHTGTLDPFASGLMVLVLGKATKISDHLRDKQKSYTLTVKLGFTTDTLDKTGQISGPYPLVQDKRQIEKALEGMEGHMKLPVPKFSAMKIKGKKLYEYARKGEDIELPLKTMNFFDMKIHSIKLDEISLSLKCSKGSYIRSWVEALGKKLQSGGFVESLCRTHVADFELTQAVDLKELLPLHFSKLSKKSFYPLEELFSDSKSLWVNSKEQRLMLNGQIAYSLKNRLVIEQKKANRSDKIRPVRVLSEETGELLSFLELVPRKKPKIHSLFNH